MSLAIRLMPEPVRSVAFGSISDVYQGMGTAMTRPIRMFTLQNMTDANMMFSFDGVHDHIPLPSWGYLILDITANKTNTQGFFLAEGQRLYVKKLTVGDVPTVLGVYLSTFYGDNL